MAITPRPAIDRFMEKVAKSSDCWLWTAACFDNGYGAFRVGERQLRAHRWSYEHFHGAIPADQVVMHSCDVRNCVNPEHLSLGSQRDNQEDMTAKGRGRLGDRNGGRAYAPKLDPVIADQIRSDYATGGFTQRQLAEHYLVCQQMISSIVRRKRWDYGLTTEFTTLNG